MTIEDVVHKFKALLISSPFPNAVYSTVHILYMKFLNIQYIRISTYILQIYQTLLDSITVAMYAHCEVVRYQLYSSLTLNELSFYLQCIHISAPLTLITHSL
jgi:hypothetical protein